MLKIESASSSFGLLVWDENGSRKRATNSSSPNRIALGTSVLPDSVISSLDPSRKK